MLHKLSARKILKGLEVKEAPVDLAGEAEVGEVEVKNVEGFGWNLTWAQLQGSSESWDQERTEVESRRKDLKTRSRGGWVEG